MENKKNTLFDFSATSKTVKDLGTIENQHLEGLCLLLKKFISTVKTHKKTEDLEKWNNQQLKKANNKAFKELGIKMPMEKES